MKDINGNDLKQPYYDLAVMRREKNPNDKAMCGFSWWITPEEYDWWLEVYSFKYPPIPQSSLDELEAWRANKVLEALSKPADTDWKAKYEELLQKHNELEAKHQEILDAFHDSAELTTEPSNFIAECAMRAMQGLLSDPNYKDVQHTIAGNIVTKPQPKVIAERAFDYAEAMAAEGKKRGHI